MLKITKTPEWTHEVTVSVPVDGGFENQSCKVRFRLVDKSVLDDAAHQDPKTMLCAVVARIDDLSDEADKPLEWNDAVRDQVFALPYAQRALITAYYASVMGAREGN